MPTLDAVLAEDGGKVKALMSLSIKMDHTSNFPKNEVVNEYKEAKKKKRMMLVTLVRHLVWLHLYVYPADYRLKNRMCDALEIRKTPKLLDSNMKVVRRK